MLGGKVTRQLLQGNLFSTFLRIPLTGHTHPSACSLMLKPWLWASTEEHGRAPNMSELAIGLLLLQGYPGRHVALVIIYKLCKIHIWYKMETLVLEESHTVK